MRLAFAHHLLLLLLLVAVGLLGFLELATCCFCKVQGLLVLPFARHKWCVDTRANFRFSIDGSSILEQVAIDGCEADTRFDGALSVRA